MMDLKVKAYFEKIPEPSLEKLMKLRDLVFRLCPQIHEKMGYGIPSYYLKHPILHIAAFKTHIGVYPGSEAIVAFKEELSPYKTSEGTIRIPLSEEIPFGLIEKIIRFNLERDN